MPRGGKRYLTDPRIVKAIRAEDPASAHRLAKACIDAAFERRETVDVEDAVAEYKALITSQGVPIRSSDDTVASWLGLG